MVTRSLLLLLSLIWLDACASSRASAQQNLFNVPSGLSTQKAHVFAQQQLNLASSTGTSNTTLDVGLTDELELGLNVNNVSLYDRTGDALDMPSPGLLFNAQGGVSFGANDRFRLSLGTQVGSTMPGHGARRSMAFTWAVGSVDLPDARARLFSGAYYANGAAGGGGLPVGGLLGAEITLVPKRFAVQVDYISGARDISVAVVGFVIELPGGMQISLGAQLPAPRSHNPVGLVVEFTQRGIPLRGFGSGQGLELAGQGVAQI